MDRIKPKKSLGQHFLTDEDIAKQIVNSLLPVAGNNRMLEIGPGMGVLTTYLLNVPGIDLKLIDIDRESVTYLKKKYPAVEDRILTGDFLAYNLMDFFHEPFSIIGNFPYNISSQILFKMLEQKELVPQLVGMFQKEVGMRICSPPKKKDYGILSVFIQAFYQAEYLFTVDEHVFQPPPKVKSGVIRLIRKDDFVLGADEGLFYKVVKAGFNQRRKTLRNALKQLIPESFPKDHPFLDLRAEALSFADFVELTNLVFPPRK